MVAKLKGLNSLRDLKNMVLSFLFPLFYNKHTATLIGYADIHVRTMWRRSIRFVIQCISRHRLKIDRKDGLSFYRLSHDLKPRKRSGGGSEGGEAVDGREEAGVVGITWSCMQMTSNERMDGTSSREIARSPIQDETRRLRYAFANK